MIISKKNNFFFELFSVGPAMNLRYSRVSMTCHDKPLRDSTTMYFFVHFQLFFIWRSIRCLGRFLGITIGWDDPSLCKSNRWLHVDILRFSFIKIYFITSSKMIGDFPAVLGALHTRDWRPKTICNVRALIGQKGGDCPSSLHTRRWRSKSPKEDCMDEKSTWSPTWRTMDTNSW